MHFIFQFSQFYDIILQNISKGCDFLLDGLDKLASGIGKAIETVPQLYEDAFQPTVQEGGKLLARIPRAINAAFAGLDKWILSKEYNIDETKKLLAIKLENVEPEKIVKPEPYIAIPALQAISYSMDSEELRNLYANLLAKSMNIDTKDYVHPAYVNIISQMTPLDAQVLKYILNEPDKDMPLVDLLAVREISELESAYVNIQSNITSLSFGNIEALSISLENLARNNLVYISESKHTNGYNSIYANEQYKLFFEKQIKNLPTLYTQLETQEKNCSLSSLGKAFCDICIS